jgi:DNA polymerase-3 subunit delta
MIIFLYGRDSYRLKQNLDKIAAEYRKKNTGMAFSVLDFAPDASVSPRQQLGELTDLIRTVSFFDEKRLIILKNAFLAGKEIDDLIKEWGLGADKQRILVFAENSEEKELSKKDRKLFNLLSAKPNIAKSFELLAGKQLENWAKKEIESLGGKIEPLALKKLISYVVIPPAKNEPPDPSSTWRLKQEIDKLANYCRGINNKQAISAKEVDLLVAPKINLNIFETIDALANRDKGKTMALLNKHLQAGEDPHHLFSMIVYQFRNLLRVKDLLAEYTPTEGIIKKTGLHPFVVRKTIEQAKKFELEELKRKFTRLADYDIAIKNGGIDVADCLYQIALN